jgi:hypothetical protein
MDVETDVFLTSAVDGGEWAVSRHGRFTPPPPHFQGNAHGIHWIGGWVGLRTGLDNRGNDRF